MVESWLVCVVRWKHGQESRVGGEGVYLAMITEVAPLGFGPEERLSGQKQVCRSTLWTKRPAGLLRT